MLKACSKISVVLFNLFQFFLQFPFSNGIRALCLFDSSLKHVYLFKNFASKIVNISVVGLSKYRPLSVRHIFIDFL